MLTPFQKRVLECVKHIPAGYITTYKILAQASGNSNASRAVGNTLARNPYSFIEKNLSDEQRIACHRIVSSDGRIGGFAGGTKLLERKIQLLADEGIEVEDGKVIDFQKKLYYFDLK